jgi:hypothetical protein
MKKLHPKRRHYELRKSRAVMRLRRKAKKPPRHRRVHPPSFAREPGVLIAPPHFVLYTRHGGAISRDIDAFFKFVLQLRESTASDLRIDMSGVRRIVVDAALLFKAELSRLIEVKGTRITSMPPKSDRTKQVLKQTGMDRLLNLTISGDPDREDVVHWRIAEGSHAIVDPSALAPIMADIESVSGMESHPVYQGIIESMANCVEHAYKPHSDVTRKMPKNPGWWVFQQVKDDILHVVICDLGIGVRRSLPLTLAGERGMYEKLMHVVRKAKGVDNRALLAAMEYGRTSTGQKQRGKGMRNAHEVVDSLGEGNFFAMSNAGRYDYSKRPDSREGSHRTGKMRHSIQGTILGWRLPLQRTVGKKSS